MSAPALPTIIQGPAIAIHNSQSFYFTNGLQVSLKRDTFNVETDAHGVIDERLSGQMFEVSGRPCGQFDSTAALNKFFGNLVIGNVGNSVFNPGAAADKTLVIHTLAGKTYTFQRSAITKAPALRLKATDTLFGDMAWTCLGKSATQPTSASAYAAEATSAFADATFEESRIITDIFTAAWGSTYTGLGSADGFEFEVTAQLETITVDGLGPVDMILKSVQAGVKFAPSTLTHAQHDALLAYQDAGAVLVGQSLAKAGDDLVITSDSLVVTLHKCGPKDAEYVFVSGQHRFKGINFVAKRTWTSGTANALWTFTVN